MAYDGSGKFNRVDNWAADAQAGTKITASLMDAEHDGFATGLSTCITKDGQTTITANLPMGGYRHTGVGNAAARTDYAAAGQIQDGALTYAGTSSGTNTITCSLSPAITAYATGMVIRFKAGGANTGAATVNVNSVGAKDIKKDVSTALASGDIASGQMVTLAYDGTNFQLI